MNDLRRKEKPAEDICPLCKGDGRESLQNGDLIKVIWCRRCNGSGKRPVSNMIYTIDRTKAYEQGSPT
jgi:DnaJ-class molecular chaperone